MRQPTIVIAASLAYSLTNFRGPLIVELLRRGYRVIASAPDIDAEVIRELQAWGAEFRRVPMARVGRNPFGDLRTCWSYHRLFRAERPDVVLAYTQKPIIYAGLALRFLPGPRFIPMVTGLGYVFTQSGRAGWLQLLTERLYRAAVGRAWAVLVFNRDDAAELVRRRIVADRALLHAVPGSGVDRTRFSRQPLPPSPPVFLLIARLLVDKGVCEYAAAARIVRRAYPDARVLLLGPYDPNPSGIAPAEVDKWVRSGALEYLGATRDVRPFLAGCTVYVLPSYREGMPRTVLEAMATGRAVVTTDAPGCRETIEDGVSGFLVPPHDADALARAMLRFCEDPALAARMGALAYWRFRAVFDVAAVNRQVAGIIDGAVAPTAAEIPIEHAAPPAGLAPTL